MRGPGYEVPLNSNAMTSPVFPQPTHGVTKICIGKAISSGPGKAHFKQWIGPVGCLILLMTVLIVNEQQNSGT
jgi:hypothetical protein